MKEFGNQHVAIEERALDGKTAQIDLEKGMTLWNHF